LLGARTRRSHTAENLMTIEENVPLSMVTTFRTGGPARFLITLDDVREIPDAVLVAEKEKLPIIPLGGGSNILAPDVGVPAVFIRLQTHRVSVEEKKEIAQVTSDAGVTWDTLVARAVQKGWWGIENLSAIPGTVGAAAVQNIGAYGAALSDTVHTVDVYDIRDRVFKTFPASECCFGYRTSIFKQDTDRYIVTALVFHLSKEARPNLSYKDLATRFAGQNDVSLADIREAVIAIRQGKFPPLSQFGTAGSFFLNPIITSADSVKIKERFPGMPLFPLPEGGVKVPLAWILDHVLNLKGRREGKAFLWEQQPLVIATEYGAAEHEIVALAQSVAHEVFEKTEIQIIPEVRILRENIISH